MCLFVPLWGVFDILFAEYVRMMLCDLIVVAYTTYVTWTADLYAVCRVMGGSGKMSMNRDPEVVPLAKTVFVAALNRWT